MRSTTLLLLLIIGAAMLLSTTRGAEGQLQQAPTPQVGWFEQTLDHFAFEPANKWQQRYLWTDQFYNPSQAGALLFYTGNEGDIYMFWNNTGFLFDLASQLNARVLFVEHRYYGESLPFGKESIFHPRYLTSEQALADYARVIEWYQRSSGQKPLPVISFGGSYGGMLTAWFRMKYPNIVAGGLASSAPILEFEGLAGYDPNSYNQIIYQDYQMQSQQCADTLQQSFPTIASLSQQGSSGLATIGTNLGLCSTPTLKDIPVINNFINGGLSYMAMTDYPGNSSFLQAMPSYPVSVACQQVSSVIGSSGSSPSAALVLQATRAALNVYYNWTGSQPCFDISQPVSGNLGTWAWDIQACTEMVFPINSGGLFPPSTFNMTSYVDSCRRINLEARPHWVALNYQSDQIAILNAHARSGQPVPTLGFSNLIFSNGQLDPWRSGGVTRTLSDSIIAIVIENGAHHVDLRFATPLDPPSVTNARTLEKKIIQGWIAEWYALNSV